MNNKLKIAIAITLLLIMVTFISCGSGNNIWEDKRISLGVDKDAYKNIKDANSKFSAKLFGELVTSETENSKIKKNIFFSPLSVSFALAMAYNGTKGTTQVDTGEAMEFGNLSTEEINAGYLSLMSFLCNKKNGVELNIGNAFFGKKELEFNKGFIQTIEDYYNGYHKSLDFNDGKSIDVINGWVSKNTKGKIKKIISSISPSKLLYLINAIYFKGEWEEPFDKDKTKDKDFTLLNGSTKKVKMMKTDGYHKYKSTDSYKSAKIPYGKDSEGDINMYLYVPKNMGNFDSFLSNFNKDKISDTLTDFKSRDLEYLELPRFEYEYDKSLIELLESMGMTEIFSPDSDLSGITTDENIIITEVLHKTYVKVDEEGTEATAVTIIEGATSCPPPDEEIGIRADKPFVFIIRDDITETILFMGVVINPEEI